MMWAAGINVALGLAAGYLFGAMATDVMRLLGMAVTTPWLQEAIDYCQELRIECFFLVIVCHMGAIAVLFAFLLTSLMGPSVYYRVMGEHGGEVSRVNAFCLAAAAALLGVMVSGATLGAIEEKMAETFPIALIYFVIPLFQMSCQMMFLTFMRFCEFNPLVQSSVLAIFAVFYPSSVLCIYTIPPFLGLGLGLAVIILLAALHLLLLCPVSSGTNCIPCFSLLASMLVARNLLHNGEFLSINPNVNVTPNTHVVEAIFTGTVGTHLFAVGVGAYMLLSLDIRQGGRLVSAGAVAGGGVVLGVVRRAPALLGMWGSLGALLGASGAVGVALSAAGATAQMYRGWIEEGEGCTRVMRERGEGGGERARAGDKRERNGGKEDEGAFDRVIKQRNRGERERGGEERQGDETERKKEGDERDGDKERQNGIALGVHFIMHLALKYIVIFISIPAVILFTAWFDKPWLFWVAGAAIWMRGFSSLLTRLHKHPRLRWSGLRGWLWRAGGQLVLLLGQYHGAIRAAGGGGVLGRVVVALGAAAGAFLSVGGQDGRFGAFAAVCAAVIPLTSYRRV